MKKIFFPKVNLQKADLEFVSFNSSVLAVKFLFCHHNSILSNVQLLLCQLPICICRLRGRKWRTPSRECGETEEHSNFIFHQLRIICTIQKQAYCSNTRTGLHLVLVSSARELPSESKFLPTPNNHFPYLYPKNIVNFIERIF